jgi:tellurite resistance protein TehA-like permease
MDEWPPFVPYLILAFICGLASTVIVFTVMAFVFRGGGSMSDASMMAVAAMAFAPAVMGIGIAAYMPREK